ncbi:MAG: EcsC family protein [Beijerinckiaceae bacterium]|nr:EcsC family protein [Beijerinckiaceae bacterium]MCI0735795.1 EcsC family protein [Beijerinckiaceae bacterium]
MNPGNPEHPMCTGVNFPAGASRLSPEDRAALQRAMRELERTSLAIRLSAILGRQASALASFVPAQLSEMANRTAEAAIRSSLSLAMKSLAGKPLKDRRRIHKSLATLAGAAGGVFGLSSLAVELPFSTTIMLRSIADIARAEGHDLEDARAALACLEVFALGGQAASNRSRGLRDFESDSSCIREGAVLETGYFALRAILAKSVTEAASYLASRGLAAEAAPALIRFVAQIGTHFGVAVSQKLVAQSVPLIGAAGGAAINYAFADHFQTIARGHFTVLRLERRYGIHVIRAEYDRMRQAA